MSATHAELVQIAADWLKKRCSVVITELVTIGEVPDAIGWQGWVSYLIECKASRSDFLADQNKYFRREQGQGIGQYRYYMAPEGLIRPEELPAHWGLLEVRGKKVCVVRQPEAVQEVNRRHEIALLLSALRRIGRNAPVGVSIRCYTIDTKNTATIGLEPDLESGEGDVTKQGEAYPEPVSG